FMQGQHTAALLVEVVYPYADTLFAHLADPIFIGRYFQLGIVGGAGVGIVHNDSIRRRGWGRKFFIRYFQHGTILERIVGKTVFAFAAFNGNVETLCYGKSGFAFPFFIGGVLTFGVVRHRRGLLQRVIAGRIRWAIVVYGLLWYSYGIANFQRFVVIGGDDFFHWNLVPSAQAIVGFFCFQFMDDDFPAIFVFYADGIRYGGRGFCRQAETANHRNY